MAAKSPAFRPSGTLKWSSARAISAPTLVELLRRVVQILVGFVHVLACVVKGDQDTEARDAVRIHRRELLDAEGSTPYSWSGRRSRLLRPDPKMDGSAKMWL
jgi:hypothetical protein